MKFRENIWEGDYFPEGWIKFGKIRALNLETRWDRRYLVIRLPSWSHEAIKEFDRDCMVARWRQLCLAYTSMADGTLGTPFDGWRFYYKDTKDEPTTVITGPELCEKKFA